MLPSCRVLAWLSISLLASLVAAGLAACDAGGGSGPGADGSVAATGCALPAGAAPPKAAPGGYYVNGNTLCASQGMPHLLHGVDRPSLEWNVQGQQLSAADFALMASWHANVVRVALNQDFWLSDSPNYSAGYAPRVDQVVQWAEQAGLDVILDLHWSDRGDYTVKPAQQQMADTHSLRFWQEVAARYKDDGRVFFELYNEPHDVSPAVWLSGGSSNSSGGFTVVGMQQLHDAVRAVGADNPVIVGGLEYAYDLSHVTNFPVQGYNILYATHPYNNAPERQPSQWFARWGYLAATAPVVATEFGDGTGSCSPNWDTSLIAYADKRRVSWTAWAWWAGDCKFPSLLTDWNANTTNEGAVVKAALLGYQDPAAPPTVDGGAQDAEAGLQDGTDDGGNASDAPAE
jgi:aryl-phospho-beta-D-glucosidase BglC (GH1 family)